MTAKFWTIKGYDIWQLEERTVCDLTNLVTGEKVRCENIIDAKFKAVIMPKVKKPRKPAKPTADKKKAAKRKSKYKGVNPSGRKFVASYWDKINKKTISLGTFDSELLAAAAVQDAKGNKKEAKRLRNEYEEGDRQPEVVHENIFQ